MTEQYDDTNRGVAFPPFPTQQLILQGKINQEGQEQKVALIKDQTKNGKNLIEIFVKVGVLFENDKRGNDSAPDYTGPVQLPMQQEMRVAAWRKMTDSNKPYLTMSVSEKRESQGQAPMSQTASVPPLNDDIPF